jgi:hypothetical protein
MDWALAKTIVLLVAACVMGFRIPNIDFAAVQGHRHTDGVITDRDCGDHRMCRLSITDTVLLSRFAT